MIIENLTFGTPLPQIVSLNAEAKLNIIIRESEKLGINVNEQQLGEIMSICIFAPDTEDTWGPVTDNQCLEALHQRGWMRAGITQEHGQRMAAWLSSAEAAWLHLALFDLIHDFYCDQASVAHCEWIQDSSGLIYSDSMKKKETIFRVMASDIYVTFPRLTSDVHGGCEVSWWMSQKSKYRGFVQLLEDYITKRRGGSIAPAHTVGTAHPGIETTTLPRGGEGVRAVARGHDDHVPTADRIAPIRKAGHRGCNRGQPRRFRRWLADGRKPGPACLRG